MKKKILSLLTAFAMVFGIIAAPFTTASAAGESTDPNAKTETVVLHKILQTKDNLDNAKFPGTTGLDNTEYDGNKINDIAGYFGENSKPIAGVFFAVQKEFEEKDTSEDAEEGATVKVWRYVAEDGSKATVQDPTAEGFEDAVLGGLTKETGLSLTTSKLEQNKTEYKIVEIAELSTYNNKGNVLADSKAVPVEITLPLTNENGVVTEAHVYPKTLKLNQKLIRTSNMEKAKQH